MSPPFRLLMISAMYENGGNVVQRLLDGHPRLFSYPFESQLGTALVRDHLSSLYPARYRWPVFALEATPEQDYEAIIDLECKVRIKTPEASKFRDWTLDMDDRERKRIFVAAMAGRERTRARLVEAFFRASSEAWADRRQSGREEVWVGYSPIVAVDAETMLADFPEARIVVVVRNPWSAYAETRQRPVPLSIEHYTTGWCVHLQAALAAAERFPDNVHLVRFEDVVDDAEACLGEVLATMGIEAASSLGVPTWNGRELPEVRPWGTIRVPSAEANEEMRRALGEAETLEVRRRTGPLLGTLGYG